MSNWQNIGIVQVNSSGYWLGERPLFKAGNRFSHVFFVPALPLEPRKEQNYRVTALETKGLFTLNVASAELRHHSLCMCDHHTESGRRPCSGCTRLFPTLRFTAFVVNRPVGPPSSVWHSFSVTAEKMLLLFFINLVASLILTFNIFTHTMWPCQ